MDEPHAQASEELNAILRQALPEAWRHEVETTLIPEGFVFRFRDSEGRQHALDARPRDLVPEALVAGDRLGYSYTSVDPTIDAAPLLDDYRAVLTALAAREGELLPWLPPPSAAPEATPAAPWRGPAPGERPAPTELVAILREALPEPWRHGLSASLTQGGFVLQFVDDRGARHALDAREIRPEAPTLVSGRTLAFSYLFVEGGAEETALAGEYRSVLSRLAAREAELLPWLDATPPAGGPGVPAAVSEAAAERLPDERPAPAELTAFLRSALPEPWRRDVEATLSPAGFILRFRDAEGRHHAFDVRDLRLVPSAFVSGRALGYSYTLVDPAVVEETVLDDYRAALTALAGREGEFVQWLSLTAADASEAPSWKGPFANEEPAPQEFEAIVSEALPPSWRSDMAAVITEAGFTLRFRDDAGARHAFDAREIRASEPALISGRVLSFSHAPLEEGAGEASFTDAHRAALSSLASREAELLPWLSQTLQQRAQLLDIVADPASPPQLDPLAQPAPPELVELLREALPERYRSGLSVSLTAGGFMLRWRDESGVEHAFDAREIRPNEPALVSGHSLAFSYLQLEGSGAASVERINEYRTALGALAARENDILPWLRSSPAPLENPERPTPQGLTALLTELLPPAWRSGVDVLLGVDDFALSFHDDANVRHLLEGRLLSSNLPALVRGEQLGFSYRKVDPALDESAMVPRYREALQTMRAQEQRIVALMNSPS